MTTTKDSLEQINQIKGMLGSALVEGSTGMVIEFAGQLNDIVQIGEAAVEFWRVNGRLEHYFAEDFGPLDAQICLHRHRVLVLFKPRKTQAAVLVTVGLRGQTDLAALNRIVHAIM